MTAAAERTREGEKKEEEERGKKAKLQGASGAKTHLRWNQRRTQPCMDGQTVPTPHQGLQGTEQRLNITLLLHKH